MALLQKVARRIQSYSNPNSKSERLHWKSKLNGGIPSVHSPSLTGDSFSERICKRAREIGPFVPDAVTDIGAVFRQSHLQGGAVSTPNRTRLPQTRIPCSSNPLPMALDMNDSISTPRPDRPE
jgi:hypothetical protein